MFLFVVSFYMFILKANKKRINNILSRFELPPIVEVRNGVQLKYDSSMPLYMLDTVRARDKRVGS